MMPRFHAWSVGVGEGPISKGHPVSFDRKVVLPKVSTSILSVLTIYNTCHAPAEVGFRGIVSSESETMSWVSSA